MKRKKVHSYSGNSVYRVSEAASTQESLDSIAAAFSYAQALDIDNGKLREPQVGALHAILSHWTIDDSKVATIVMPTGTGKTETMLATFCMQRPKCLLVLVPSAALRKQISQKFLSLGILPEIGVLAKNAKGPYVGVIEHGFENKNQATLFVNGCNVVVATVSAINESSPDVIKALMEPITHVFVDEAHHIAAKTWQNLLSLSAGKPVLQFTATPFRRDGQRVDGKIIYSYPLGKAQQNGYFSKINYYGVTELLNSDEVIAKKALEVLRADLAAKRDHVLMARVKSKDRAKVVLPIYEKLAGDLKPVLLHSGETAAQQRKALKAVEASESRIVVCVNMLGEGYDLPQLKVAAIHDPHKSLAITLQFIGRFARVKDNASIGEASVIIERAGLYEDENLARLTADDPDWNEIIKDLSETAIQEQEELNQFEEQFNEMPPEISLKNLLPKMSTVVYKTACESWSPTKIYTVFPKNKLLTKQLAINNTDHVVWLVTEEKTDVEWGNIKNLKQVNYDLYVLFWDSKQNLLFINSSNKETLHTRLAKEVCGNDTELIHGDPVYRAMAKINRLVPTNVGLLDGRNRKRSFTSYAGANVTSGLPSSQTKTKVQTNIFGHGYEAGDKVNIGVSLKGRLWARRVAPTLKHWTDWCTHIGKKLLDESIDVNDIRKHFLKPQLVTSRPKLVPLAIAWPYYAYTVADGALKIQYKGKSVDIIDAGLELTDYKDSGPIKFKVAIDDESLEYEVVFDSSGVSFKPTGVDAKVLGHKDSVALSGYMNTYGLAIYFEDDTTITNSGYLLRYDRTLVFDTAKIQAIDWSGINIRRESQGKERDSATVQARTIKHLEDTGEWDIIIDDDGPAEVADIVALKVKDQELVAYLGHCKFSGDDQPGARVGDLYEVCGQAQKSMLWASDHKAMLKNLIRREKARQLKNESGIIKGTLEDLLKLEMHAKYLNSSFTVAVSQPGLAKSSISPQQQHLLACTDTYLYETYEIKFEVISSA